MAQAQAYHSIFPVHCPNDYIATKIARAILASCHLLSYGAELAWRSSAAIYSANSSEGRCPRASTNSASAPMYWAAAAVLGGMLAPACNNSGFLTKELSALRLRASR